MSFSLAKLLGSIVRSNLSKNKSHFPRQLNEDFEELFNQAKNLFWFRISMAECRKLQLKRILLKFNENRRHVWY